MAGISFARNVYDALVEDNIDITFAEVLSIINNLPDSVFLDLQEAMETGEIGIVINIIIG